MSNQTIRFAAAAALLAATIPAVHAADVVVAEPEPVNYVRVCDAFGAGYFYIPGTETCLKIGGYVRYDIDIDATGWSKLTRGQLEISALSSTDLGDLEGFIALRGDIDGTTYEQNIYKAYVRIGGLTLGYTGDFFDDYYPVGEYPGLGGDNFNLISWTNTIGAFDYGVQLVDDDNGDFTPNVGVTLGYTADKFSARFTGAWDNDGGYFALKGQVDASVGDNGTLGLAGIWSDGPTYTWYDSAWTVVAAYEHVVTDKVLIAGAVQYWGDVLYVPGVNAWGGGVNVDFTPVENFLVRGQVDYYAEDGSPDELTGRIRFERSF